MFHGSFLRQQQKHTQSEANSGNKRYEEELPYSYESSLTIIQDYGWHLVDHNENKSL